MQYTDKLSPHFTYGEMVTSETATRLMIDNNPNNTQIENLKVLCINVLEPIRSHYKKPIIVHSGYRCPEVNKLIGGAERSQHTFGEAADIDVFAVKTTGLFEWIVLESELIYDQIICEFLEWVHISYKRNGNNRLRNTVARKVDGQTVYKHYTKEQIKNGNIIYE